VTSPAQTEKFEEAVARHRAGHSEADLLIRLQRLEWLVNQIVEGSLRALPRTIRRRLGRAAAVDGTVIRAFARGTRNHRSGPGFTKKVRLHSSDPDAGYSHRDADSRDDGLETRRSRSAWGYEATLVISGTDDPTAPEGAPNVILGMILGKPGFEPGQNAVAALRNIRDRGYDAGWLAGEYRQGVSERPHADCARGASGYSGLGKPSTRRIRRRRDP